MIPGLGRSAGEGRGYPLQYLGLENSMDCIVHGVTKSRTQLSNFHFTHCIAQEAILNIFNGKESEKGSKSLNCFAVHLKPTQ